MTGVAWGVAARVAAIFLALWAAIRIADRGMVE